MKKTDDDRLDASDVENALRRSFAILLRMWWVVVLVFAITFGASYASWSPAADTYVARTKLLIIAPASERILGEAGAPVLSLSAATLSELATANDLMQAIISDLSLVDGAGRPWAVESLAGMLDAEVALSGEGTRLPLITTTVRGGDPKIVARIANKWAESFAQKNSELFASEAAGSYEFVATRYQNNQEELRATQAERLTYEQARQAERLTYVQTRQAERLTYVQTRQAERLTEEDGRHADRLAYEQERDAEPLTYQQARQGERLTYQQARQGERVTTQQARQEERFAFERDAPSTSLKSQLDVLTAKYSDFLGQLQAKRSALVAAQARLASVGEALAVENPFLTYERRISSDAIWSIVAGNPGGLTEEALSDLVMEDQERNDLYLTLRTENATLQSAVASLTAEIGHLEAKTDEFQQEIENLTGRIGRMGLDLLEFDQNTTDMFTRFDQNTTDMFTRFDQETSAELVVLDQETTAGLARFDRETTAKLTRFDLDTAAELSSFDQKTGEELARLDGDANLTLSQLDQEISVLNSNHSRLAQGVHDAGLAKAEQAGSIRVVESAVEPRSPSPATLSSGSRVGFLIALGLALGVAAAFVVHYVWDALRSANDTESQRPSEME